LKAIPDAQAEELAKEAVKRIQRSTNFKVKICLPGSISVELEKEMAVQALKRGFDVEKVSKVYQKGKSSKKYFYAYLKAIL
jgi:PP-loop superfamily ATP-utilizing enzyme